MTRSKRDRNRDAVRGKPAPRREALSSDNIGIGTAVAALGWGVVSLVVKMPELLVVGGTATVGGLGVAQTVKAKWERRRERRRGKGDKK